jgi:Protein of unknown function (DUF3501)
MIARDSLLSLEAYARERQTFRAKVIEHKKRRTLHIGEHVSLQFEDELLIERIFEAQGIQSELDAYNPLLPDGGNWKATMFIEYPDVEERRRMLERLKGIERNTWVQVEGGERIYAIADEDLERENEEKTSAVHFVRFEVPAAQRERLKRGARLTIGVDHPEYRLSVEPSPEQRQALIVDLV